MGRGPDVAQGAAESDVEPEVAVAAVVEALRHAGQQVVQRLGDQRIEGGDCAGCAVREMKGMAAADVEFPVGGSVEVDSAGDEVDFLHAEHAAEQGGKGDPLWADGVLELGQGDGGGTTEQGGEHGAAAGGEAKAAGAEFRDEFGVRERGLSVGRLDRGGIGRRGRDKAERGARGMCRRGRCAGRAERCHGGGRAGSGCGKGFEEGEYGGRRGGCLSGAA